MDMSSFSVYKENFWLAYYSALEYGYLQKPDYSRFLINLPLLSTLCS
jgi:hypothetical protein